MPHLNQDRAATPSRSKVPDAIALLKQDHRTVEELFEEFSGTEGGDGIDIAQRICRLLGVHMQIEEEILYPAAKEALEDDEQSDLVYEAEVEHTSAKELIAKIKAMKEQDETYNATVQVLSEYIKHHVKEEERELFPALKKMDVDLKALGEQLSQRKQALFSEFGLPEAEQTEGRRARRKTSSKRSKSAGTSRH